jgi:hypothetical protein
MNALKARKKYDQQQELLALKQRRKEEQEKIDAMDDEIRKAYLAEKERKRRLFYQLLGTMNTMGGDYLNFKW